MKSVLVANLYNPHEQNTSQPRRGSMLDTGIRCEA